MGTSIDAAAAVVAETFPVTVVSGQTSQPSLFAQASDGADVVKGSDVVNPADMVGVPFVITSATFRDGFERTEGIATFATNYVSLECIVGDAAALADATARATKLKNETLREQILRNLDNAVADSSIVINDGSTGICRAMVEYFHNKGIIQVPEGEIDGYAGSSRFDTYRAEWIVGAPEADDKGNFPPVTLPVKLVCLRGLRASEYEYQKGKMATTFYLA